VISADFIATADDHLGAARLEAAEQSLRSLTFRGALLSTSGLIGRAARHLSPHREADAARSIGLLRARIQALAPDTENVSELFAAISADANRRVAFSETLQQLIAVAKAHWPDLGSALAATTEQPGSACHSGLADSEQS
jgi:hypothetical protein